jgi:hypothetical protein
MQDEAMPSSVAELLARIDRDWKGLWQLVDQCDMAQMETPDAGGWSVKDNLAHLAAWERYLVEHTLQGQPAHVAMGIDEPAVATLDEAGLNALLLAHSRNRSLADVAADARQTHQAAVNAIAALTFDSLLRPLDAAGPEQTLLQSVAGNTYEHYQEHAAMILVVLLEQQD